MCCDSKPYAAVQTLQGPPLQAPRHVQISEHVHILMMICGLLFATQFAEPHQCIRTQACLPLQTTILHIPDMHVHHSHLALVATTANRLDGCDMLTA
jgi:hypothetical protein